MAKIELLMPKMGESIIEATILKWNKAIGEEVEQDESVLEIATDKVDSEVPAPEGGKLLEIKHEEGAVVPVGEVIAIIETEAVSDTASTPISEPDLAAAKLAESVPYIPADASSADAGAAPGEKGSASRFYSPLVLNIARTEGISMFQLEQISGSGRGGRVTKKDMLAFVKELQAQPNGNGNGHQESGKVSPTPSTARPAVTAPIQEKRFSHSGPVEVVPMDRMRKLIAENMIYSQNISAHVTSFVEADVTSLVMWRNKVKHQFQERYGEKLTFTPLFIQALIKALKRFPGINASVEGDKLLIKKDINVGIAVALPTDNLIVPVIKHADRMNLLGLTASVNDLAQRARKNKLKPEELEGGSYTLSNVGTFGNVMGTPIIMQPQLAIMAVGAIRKVPAVLETETGDVIAIRHRMFLSHSYDHRVIDGALGGKFVKHVADTLESWDINTEI